MSPTGASRSKETWNRCYTQEGLRGGCLSRWIFWLRAQKEARWKGRSQFLELGLTALVSAVLSTFETELEHFIPIWFFFFQNSLLLCFGGWLNTELGTETPKTEPDEAGYLSEHCELLTSFTLWGPPHPMLVGSVCWEKWRLILILME